MTAAFDALGEVAFKVLGPEVRDEMLMIGGMHSDDILRDQFLTMAAIDDVACFKKMLAKNPSIMHPHPDKI